jgi:hypothetical protein
MEAICAMTPRSWLAEHVDVFLDALAMIAFFVAFFSLDFGMVDTFPMM